MRTINDVLKRFEANLLDGDPIDDCGGSMLSAKECWEFAKESIKDALEACRVAEKAHKCTHPESCSLEFYAEGFNQATTQYDENVKAFLDEK